MYVLRESETQERRFVSGFDMHGHAYRTASLDEASKFGTMAELVSVLRGNRKVLTENLLEVLVVERIKTPVLREVRVLA